MFSSHVDSLPGSESEGSFFHPHYAFLSLLTESYSRTLPVANKKEGFEKALKIITFKLIYLSSNQ
jgi:hypothetical protein